jgi:hypothetical protein
MEFQHQNLAQGRWKTLSLAEQLGNVGSEYGRALNWKKKNNGIYFQKAFERMLELLDMTIADTRWHNHRLRELTRLREVVCEELTEDSESKINLNKYFMQFAVLAAMDKS